MLVRTLRSALCGALLLTAVPAFAQTLVWSDEFDSPTLDRSTWTFNTGGSGFGNGELQYYTARPENVRVDNGSLVIEVRRDNYLGDKAFTSARLVTNGRFAFRYGTIEARIKLPNVDYGLWPALWLMGSSYGALDWPAAGEVDIMEFGRKDGHLAGVVNRRALAAAHWELNDEHVMHDGFIDWPTILCDDFHLFRLEWTPARMQISVDNVPYWSLDISNPAAHDLEEFHEPMFLLTNVAVGGWNFIEITDPGAITATLPARMYIDYIRLYDNGNTELYFADDARESGLFGIFTETAPVNNHVQYETDAELFLWNNLTAVADTPYEGHEVWSMTAAPGTWWGMGVLSTHFDRNLQDYSDGHMHLHMKTTATDAFKIGLKSATSGESWVYLNDEHQYGLVRDGLWHEVVIPLNAFLNLDFRTVSQLFMIAGDPPASAVQFAIDNVYWTPDVARPTPEHGNFGILTENPAHQTAGAYQLGVDGALYIWEHTLVEGTQTPYEGAHSLSLTSAPGLNWFGAAFTPTIKYNLSAFRFPESKLHFALKTSSTAAFRLGMRSGNVNDIGQKWIEFASGRDPYGFVRDGQWHVVEIPMSDFDSVELTEVSLMFELLGVAGPITGIEFDDVCLLNGGAALPVGAGYPTADAGADQVVILPANSAVLDGSQSSDDGAITGFAWAQVSGPSVATLSGANAAVLTVSNLIAGTYVFRLTVTDDEGLTSSDNASVTVAAPAPTANAGPDQSVALPQRSVTLTGSGFDVDGEIVAYHWTQVSGPTTAMITNAGSATATAADLYEGVYVFELTVTDNDGRTGSDQTAVEVMRPLLNIALHKPATASSSIGSDLVTNGGFESGSGTQASGWTLAAYPAGSSSAVAARDATLPRSGAWRLALTVAGAPNGGPAAEARQLTPVGSVVPGVAYDLVVPARRVGAFGPGVIAQLAIQWLDSDGSHGGGVKGGTGFMSIEGGLTETYASFGFTNVVAPPGCDSALLMVRMAGGALSGSNGAIACDDITLTSLGGAQGPERAVDGNATTHWASAAGMPQWIDIALGAHYQISQVVLDWAQAPAQAYDLDVSDDGTGWTTVYSTASGAGGKETIDLSAAGRFIRLYAHAGSTPNGCSLDEFEVYGALRPGDIDGDGHVDFTDFVWLAGCLTGPQVAITPECQAADLDLNAAVDLRDLAILQVAAGVGS
jgi:beta-glucanase (GH16 family)